MKSLITGFMILSSLSAFAKGPKYKCQYQDQSRSESSSAANSFWVNFDKEGLSMNDLRIEVLDNKINIKYFVNDELIKESEEDFGVETFTFAGEKIKSEKEYTDTYLRCWRK